MLGTGSMAAMLEARGINGELLLFLLYSARLLGR